MKSALLACSLCLLPVSAHAETDASTLLKLYDAAGPAEKNFIANSVSDVEVGLLWANTFLTTERKELALYCQPGNLALTGEQLVDILRRELNAHPFEGESPFGMVMIIALRRIFPCSQKLN